MLLDQHMDLLLVQELYQCNLLSHFTIVYLVNAVFSAQSKISTFHWTHNLRPIINAFANSRFNSKIPDTIRIEALKC